ncbi:MAG: hypothetical protein LBT50_00490, partial [Prevotellaceae bacterium]|nr:hypothetical protein [Prevotellaceae bacterium]
FQTNKDNTVISVKYFNSRQLISSYKAGLDISSLVKIISVLKYRDSASDEDIKRILKLRYYRSNVAAHNTGNVDMKKYKISKNEIEFFLKVLKKVFEK